MHAILFDIGKVLVHYDHRRTLTALAAACGATVAAVRSAYQEIAEAFGLGQLDPIAFCAHMQAHTGACTLPCDSLWEAFCAGLARDEAALAYAVELQGRLGVTVGAISNTNAVHVAWLDANVPELGALDLVIMSNEVELLKPDPEIYRIALELLEVTVSQVLYVDDSALNVAAAQALGMAGLVHADWAATRPVIEEWVAQK